VLFYLPLRNVSPSGKSKSNDVGGKIFMEKGSNKSFFRKIKMCHLICFEGFFETKFLFCLLLKKTKNMLIFFHFVHKSYVSKYPLNIKKMHFFIKLNLQKMLALKRDQRTCDTHQSWNWVGFIIAKNCLFQKGFNFSTVTNTFFVKLKPSTPFRIQFKGGNPKYVIFIYL
jgi:hypothetical protein